MSNDFSQFRKESLATIDIRLRRALTYCICIGSKMLFYKSISAYPIVSLMKRNLLAIEKDFDLRASIDYLSLLTYILIGHRVVVLITTQINATILTYS